MPPTKRKARKPFDPKVLSLQGKWGKDHLRISKKSDKASSRKAIRRIGSFTSLAGKVETTPVPSSTARKPSLRCSGPDEFWVKDA